MGDAPRMDRSFLDDANLGVGVITRFDEGFGLAGRPKAGDPLHFTLDNAAPFLDRVAIKLDLITIGVEHINAMGDLVIDRHVGIDPGFL